MCLLQPPDYAKTNHNRWMHRLIFAGRTGLTVGFVVRWLILYGKNGLAYIVIGKIGIKINILFIFLHKLYVVDNHLKHILMILQSNIVISNSLISNYR